MNLISRAIGKLKRDKLNKQWRNMDFILTSNQLNLESKNKLSDIIEAEHQIGRYLNMEKIVAEIGSSGHTGDVVEFGTWQGLGLILFYRLFKSSSRKFIGVDSFEGLPSSSNFWKRGDFNDTSIDLAMANIRKFTGAADQFQLIKGWFSDKSVSDSLNKATSDVILIHFDADLGVSTSQALQVIQPFLENRKKPIYFLFDDWGLHPDEVPDAFLNWADKTSSRFGFNLIKLSSTRCTRYYRLDFRQ